MLHRGHATLRRLSKARSEHAVSSGYRSSAATTLVALNLSATGVSKHAAGPTGMARRQEKPPHSPPPCVCFVLFFLAWIASLLSGTRRRPISLTALASPTVLYTHYVKSFCPFSASVTHLRHLRRHTKVLRKHVLRDGVRQVGIVHEEGGRRRALLRDDGRYAHGLFMQPRVRGVTWQSAGKKADE